MWLKVFFLEIVHPDLDSGKVWGFSSFSFCTPPSSITTDLSIQFSLELCHYLQTPYLDVPLNPYISSAYSVYPLLFGQDQVSLDLNAYVGDVSSTIQLAQQCGAVWGGMIFKEKISLS